uniref:Pecanex-like protein n=1 Tax=Ascaris lumbricoides TaxID=6252 RepID=A0A0M3HJ28_ASCLU
VETLTSAHERQTDHDSISVHTRKQRLSFDSKENMAMTRSNPPIGAKRDSSEPEDDMHTITHHDREELSYSDATSTLLTKNNPKGNVDISGRNASEIRLLLTNLSNLEDNDAITNRSHLSFPLTPEVEE